MDGMEELAEQRRRMLFLLHGLGHSGHVGEELQQAGANLAEQAMAELEALYIVRLLGYEDKLRALKAEIGILADELSKAHGSAFQRTLPPAVRPTKLELIKLLRSETLDPKTSETEEAPRLTLLQAKRLAEAVLQAYPELVRV